MLRVALIASISSWCAVVASAARADLTAPAGAADAFEAWMREYKKVYASAEEYALRLEHFTANVAKAALLNSNPDDTAMYGATRFADLSEAEFRSQFLMPKLGSGLTDVPAKGNVHPPLPTTGLPTDFSWVTKGGVVTSVKDQDACGSCWAFSAVQNVEGRAALAGLPLADLSVQQILECDATDAACYGGYPQNAWQYMIDAGGIVPEASYPYVPENHVICLANQTYNHTLCNPPPCTYFCDMSCKAPLPPVAVRVKSFESVLEDEDQMAAYLVQYGPLSVGVDASVLNWYHSGISNPWNIFCGTDVQDIDHAVLIVGYGVEKGKKYWTIKNSWGAKWGEHGYYRLLRGVNKCAVTRLVGSAIV